MNEHTLVVLQIETVRAFEMRDELLSVPGIDAVMVGPADLSISLGVPGDFDHPKMVETITAIKDSCIRHGVIPGMQTRTPALARFWKEHGMLFLGCNNETGMLFERASELVKQLSA
jgi:2-dehydro-3-deoxyglucarate aldolase/4-hydroxy-2-oxoheptanedioate aldolase